MNVNISKEKPSDNPTTTKKPIIDSRIAVSPLTRKERQEILLACRVAGMRRPQFYREAIMNKTKAILETGINHVN